MTTSRVSIVAVKAADTIQWVKPDLATRLLPFAVVVALVWAVWRPAWLGISAGDVQWQLGFGFTALPVMFVLAAVLQLVLSRRRGALRVGDVPDVVLEAAFYALNGPLEEGFFRGLLQGGLGALLGAPAGFVVGTASYVFYHRLGGWSWPDVAATALAGIPLGLAFWLLPGPPSLLGVSIAHLGATCGFLGPGPWLLHRLRLV
jgi:membrane protease YdiL (CAAX protease family)